MSMEDLFERPEGIPSEVQAILDEFDDDCGNSYLELARILKKMESIGYTFDYGLDACPFDLHKI